MQIYLLKDLAGKGKAGEIINVNDGYGKNFLIKNKIGVAVTPDISAQVKSKADANAFHMAEDKAKIKAIITKLSDAVITIKASVGESGKMFGSITGTEIAKSINELGFEIEKRNIILPESIKALGEYRIKVKFQYGMEGEFKLIVEK